MCPTNTNLRSRLEQFGDPRKTWQWQAGEVDCLTKLEVTAADIPELLTIAHEWTEPMDWPDDEDYVAGYAPIHAWRCLCPRTGRRRIGVKRARR